LILNQNNIEFQKSSKYLLQSKKKDLKFIGNLLVDSSYLEGAEERKENFNSLNLLRKSEKSQNSYLLKTKMNSSCNVFGFSKNLERSSYNKFENNVFKNTTIFKNRLNYEIEINHPFLEKCVIRGSNTLEAFDLYKKLQQIITEFD